MNVFHVIHEVIVLYLFNLLVALIQIIPITENYGIVRVVEFAVNIDYFIVGFVVGEPFNGLCVVKIQDQCLLRHLIRIVMFGCNSRHLFNQIWGWFRYAQFTKF